MLLFSQMQQKGEKHRQREVNAGASICSLLQSSLGGYGRDAQRRPAAGPLVVSELMGRWRLGRWWFGGARSRRWPWQAGRVEAGSTARTGWAKNSIQRKYGRACSAARQWRPGIHGSGARHQLTTAPSCTRARRRPSITR